MSKSVAKNALFNAVRTVSYMLFPLITYPYVTRTLLAENLGKVDFTTSLISYFTLIAGLGITSYATREGAAYRQDRKQISEFCSQVFTINVLSTLVSYALLATLFFLWPKLQGYGTLMAIQALMVAGTTLGVEWIYTIHEDYGFITIRTIAVQIVSAVLLFTLVKDPSDYLVYAAIIVFSNVGANVFNFIHARKYVSIRLTTHFDVWHHLLPMLVLFGNTIAVTIYVNTDVTLLGIFKTDFDVGIYGVAVRIYTIVKQLLNSLITVSIPRLSLYCANEQKEEYRSLLQSVAHGLTITVYPILCILFLMSNYVVFIIGGEAFSDSNIPLRILCFSSIPAVFATFAAYTILLPNKREDFVLKSTIAGALINLVLNLIAIPLFGYVGAAITTGIAEATVFITALRYSSSIIDLRKLLSSIKSPLLTAGVAIALMVCASVLLKQVFGFSVPGFFVTGLVLFAIYITVLLVRKDAYVWRTISSISARIGGSKERPSS